MNDASLVFSNLYICTDFDVEPENMKVKHILNKAHNIIRSGKILPAPSADESKIYSCCPSESTESFHLKIRPGGRVI